MTEPEEPALRREPAAEDDPVKSLREWGTMILLGGAGLTLVLLVFAGREPSWPWLLASLVAVLTGLGLRLEAAIRDRP